MGDVPRGETWALWKIRSADRPGLVAACSGLVHRLGGNILEADQHTDRNHGKFFMRLRWDMEDLPAAADGIREAIGRFSRESGVESHLLFSDQTPRIAVMVSRELHCLYDLCLEDQAGRLGGKIQLILSNHTEGASAARHFDIPFHHLPMDAGKTEVEARQLALFSEHGIDLIILARYMQILSADYCRALGSRTINIHHGFLPAFQGARPYHQAYERGVKMVGATAHYVTEDLDEGPIIAQDILSISHRDGVQDLVEKGRDLEKRVLTQAVKWHLDQRVFLDGNKTIVFT